MAQANSRYRHFPESAANFIVDALLHDIFEHCSSQDVEVCKAGLYGLRYALCISAAPLQEACARRILSLMKHNLQWAANWGWGQQRDAMACLSVACKALNTAEQQECMALLVSMLELEPDWQRQLIIVSEMQIFWRAVADPYDTYAATAKQLGHMQRSEAVHCQVRSGLLSLL